MKSYNICIKRDFYLPTLAPCEVGYYSEDSQSKECLPCPNNTYQDKFGSTSCKKCPQKSEATENSSHCFNAEEVVLKSWKLKDEQFGDELYYLLMLATCCFIILTVFAMW
ncbi:hypothetical protein HELRODRAFT_180447 [Helobdella robusta]|uniref:Tyrosine-protein kinase ephrin type A/B receptor-like domain-containing protein n=1 Tax=Helobdella robusta TaxID=6412 RepID=T1FFX5_HELRO|nr:hypothetical protein HELRODRAFT_180447 [Helobdella robusta]ESN94020.1 hypothetical protein HELRODRAFT_180447 [Helobdella robusta]